MPAPKPGGQPAGERWIPAEILRAADIEDIGALQKELRAEHKRLIELLPRLLAKIADRVLPLRKRHWEWRRVTDREKEGRLHGLDHSPGGGRSGEAVDLVRLTRLMANFYQQTTGRHQFIVSADVPELFGPWGRSHLERVLGNVLLNAIKYSPGGGDIGIGVGRDDDGLGCWATLSVQNRGPGIPLEDLPGLAQPGYRARNVGAIPGTGFGLASVREVVEQQGGSFAIQSEVGGSTTVLVRLPL